MLIIEAASFCGSWLSVRKTPTRAEAATSNITTAVWKRRVDARLIKGLQIQIAIDQDGNDREGGQTANRCPLGGGDEPAENAAEDDHRHHQRPGRLTQRCGELWSD